MPTRIVKPDRIIVHAPKSVPRLRALRLFWNDAIWLREPAKRAVIPTSLVKHQPKVADVAVLAGISVFRLLCSARIAHFAPGFVAQL